MTEALLLCGFFSVSGDEVAVSPPYEFVCVSSAESSELFRERTLGTARKFFVSVTLDVCEETLCAEVGRLVLSSMAGAASSG
jgi:hypothetical protein